MVAGPIPPLAACLQWAILLGVNHLAKRLQKGIPHLRRSELLLILAVWVAANMVSGRGLLHPFLSSLAGSVYFARGAAATSAISQHLPDWMALTDRQAAVWFFEGYGVPVPWALWLRPLCFWFLFFIPFLMVNICISALFERIWVRHEKLTYPVVALPIFALSEKEPGENERSFRRAFAVGISVPILLHGFGAVHAYVPAIPCIPFYNDVSEYLVNAPYSSLKPVFLNLYPSLIGLTFLAPVDLSFSIWFFLIVNKTQLLMTALMGWNDGVTGGNAPVAPFVEEQSAGAFLALAFLFCWGGRKSLFAAIRTLWSRGAERSDVELRWLAAGLILGAVEIGRAHV